MIEKVLVTFASDGYEDKRSLTNSSCSQFVDRVINYSPKNLDKKFIKENYEIMSKTKGYGYWLWKPYIILQTLELLNDSSMIVYCDSGDKFTKDIVSRAEERVDTGTMLVESSHKNYKYTKSDCFVLMGCNNEAYWNSNQIYASISFWKKTSYSIDLLEEWLKFCSNPQIITDNPNIHSSNHPEFIDHRHDQSILTNLAIKNSAPACKEKSSDPWDVF